jgi:hypothetical protein
LNDLPVITAKAEPKITGPISESLRADAIRVCRFCADPDCDNPLFCESYEPVPNAVPLDTVHMGELLESLGLPVSDMWGNALFSKHTLLLLQVAGNPVSLVLHPNERLLLGRVDEAETGERVLDLTPYDAHKHGVSRVHASIGYAGHTLTLTDLGSTNGTFINNQRLVARQPRILRDGDLLRLGSLVVQVSFK